MLVYTRNAVVVLEHQLWVEIGYVRSYRIMTKRVQITSYTLIHLFEMPDITVSYSIVLNIDPS